MTNLDSVIKRKENEKAVLLEDKRLYTELYDKYEDMDDGDDILEVIEEKLGRLNEEHMLLKLLISDLYGKKVNGETNV